MFCSAFSATLFPILKDNDGHSETSRLCYRGTNIYRISTVLLGLCNGDCLPDHSSPTTPLPTFADHQSSGRRWITIAPNCKGIGLFTDKLLDMIYGLCNTISGAIFLANGQNTKSEPDTACLVSGWFSQSNAQAIDFNILIISITVLLSVVKKDLVSNLGTKWQVLICVAAWVPGIITGKTLHSLLSSILASLIQLTTNCRYYRPRS